jgi:SAM-dependent methyltransferase
MQTKLSWPAPERNKQPILSVLERVLPASGTLLEIASGTGQHAAYFARRLPGLVYQPSDIDDANLASIRAWVAEAALPNLLSPVRLDVCEAVWPSGTVDAIYNANLVHISPWECTVGLLQGAARYLSASGVLVLYGPYRIGGEHTAPSNASFDADLRARDSRFGVRDLEAVSALAAEHGFALLERVEMPANNQTLVFRRSLE